MQHSGKKAIPNAEQSKGTPFWLKKYENANYITQQRVRFAFYLCIVLVALNLALIILTSYNQIKNPVYGQVNFPTIAPMLITLVIFMASTFILIKGQFKVASHIILITAFAAIWSVLWLDRNHSLQRLDTITYAIAILAMAPLLIEKKGYHILIYTGANLLVFFIFLHLFKNELMISDAALRDYKLDTSIPLLFVGIVGFSVFHISKNALNHAEGVIKERIKAEQLLANSEKKYREMTEFLPQVVFESDLQGNLKYINKRGLELFGYSETDLSQDVNYNVNLLALVQEKDLMKDNVQRLLQNKVSKGNIYHLIKKDGNLVPIQVFSSLVEEDGNTIGIRGIVIDITERIEAEKAIRESQELFKTLIDSAPVAMSLSDMNERYIIVNKVFSEETGLPPEKIIGKTPSEIGIIIDEESKKKITTLLAEKGLVENLESIIYEKGEKKIDALYYSRLIVVNNKKSILSSIINITEKKKNEKELEEYRNHLEFLVKERTEGLAAANEELSAANEELYSQREELMAALENLKKAQQKLVQSEKLASLGVLSAGVAHEINNPLNYISGGVMGIEKYVKENLSDHVGPLSILFDAVAEGVKRVSIIVESLNRFGKQADTGYELCNVHSVIDDCLQILEEKIIDRISIQKDYTHEPFTLHCNLRKFNQTILSIITNSVQAIKGAGTIYITTKLRGNSLELIITDTGEGIDKDSIGKIFDPFFTSKDPRQGVGLGLSFAYETIKEMEGSIEYDSEKGKGTTAKIVLPTTVNKG